MFAGVEEMIPGEVVMKFNSLALSEEPVTAHQTDIISHQLTRWSYQ